MLPEFEKGEIIWKQENMKRTKIIGGKGMQKIFRTLNSPVLD